MNNKLIIGAAGSGKTRHIIEEALRLKNEKILITTFTEANKNEIIRKFFDILGYVPTNIVVQTWFSFLIQHGVKPFQSVIYDCYIKGMLLVDEKSGVKYYSNKGPIYYSEADAKNYYFSSDNKIYSDKITKFVVNANKKASGNIIRRLNKIFKHIFIDEIQDMAGYDLEIIKLLFESDSNILLVGDPRQVTYQTHYEQKNIKYRHGNIINFIKDKCTKCNVEIDDETLNITYRNNKSICAFANTIYPDFRQCSHATNEKTGHDGIFFVAKDDLDQYLIEFNPVQLRDSGKTVVDNQHKVMNFGASKGLTFDRVLIYPTKPILEWIFDHSKDLAGQSRSKLYVAITRAKYSVAIVVEKLDDICTEDTKNIGVYNKTV